MAQFVTKIKELPIASDRAKADIAGNSIVDTYATKTEGAKVAASEGQTQGYLSDVLKAGDGIELSESDGVITASTNVVKILQFNSTLTADEWKDLYDKLKVGDITLFCKKDSGLYPMSDFTESKITFFGFDMNSTYAAKSRTLHLDSTGAWTESSQFFVPNVTRGGVFFAGVPSFGSKTLTAKSSNYWTKFWVPIFSIPIGRFNLSIQIIDTASAYSTTYSIHLLGIDSQWLTASYSCLNTDEDFLRIWHDSSNWYIGFDGNALSDASHTIKFLLESVLPYNFSVITSETRLDPSTLDISGVHLQKPVANTLPDWQQSN